MSGASTIPAREREFRWVAFVLRYGALVSALLMAAGVALALVAGGSLTAPHRLGDFPQLLSHLVELDAGTISELGLVVLLLTPVARILATLAAFARLGEHRQALAALGVLAIVLYGMSLAVRG
jgi:uncharacterized membrane protein